MNSAHDFWKSAADQELLEAAQNAAVYSDDELEVIRAVIKTRQLTMPTVQDTPSSEGVAGEEGVGKPEHQTWHPTSDSVEERRSNESESNSIAVKLKSRYREAYGDAKARIRVAKILKNIGFALGVLIVFATFITDRADLFFPSLIIAFVVSSSFYSMSIGIAVRAQLLLASLDTAVNTSPFLSESEKAEIMGLH